MNSKVNKIKCIKRDWRLYVFLLVPVLYIVIFKYIPLAGNVVAFKDYSIRKGILGSDWVGVDNFIKFFNSYQFGRVLKNTLVLSFYSIVAAVPVPIIFALILNVVRNKRVCKVVQTITTLPHFISVVVMVGILFQVLDARTGLYGSIAYALTGSYPESLFVKLSVFPHMYVWSGVWQSFGWSSIIYTAALAGVSPEYHEAAQIDGASRFQRVLYIDIPEILPTIIIMFILRMGSVMSVGFEKVFLLQNDLNLSVSETISTYEYAVGLEAGGAGNLSYSTAIGMFNSVINLIMICVFNRVARKVSETSLW